MKCTKYLMNHFITYCHVIFVIADSDKTFKNTVKETAKIG